MDRQGIPDNGCCNKKWIMANGFQTVWWDEQLKCRWWPQTTTTRQRLYQNELIQVHRCQTMQYSTCHDCHEGRHWRWPVPEYTGSEVSWGHRSCVRSIRGCLRLPIYARLILVLHCISCQSIKYLWMDRFIGQIDTDISPWRITTLCLVAQMMNCVLVLVTNVNVSCLHTNTHIL